MVHDIYNNDRFASREKPAWHGLGKTFIEPLTASEAVELAGMEYHVEKVPHEVEVDGILVTTLYDLIRMPSEADPDPAYFGTVSEDYEVLNNMDIAKALDPLTGRWPVETVGALKQGESVFFTFRAGEFSIGKDDIKGYFLVHESKTGRGGLRIAFTPIRVVCQNTLTMGLTRSQVSVNISHSKGASAELNFWAEILPLMEKAQAETRKTMEALSEFKLTKAMEHEILRAAYPDPPAGAKARLKAELEGIEIPEALQAGIDKASDTNLYYKNRQSMFRDATAELYDIFNQQFPQTARTGWALTNAIAESEDWRRGREPEYATVFAGDRVRAKERGFRKAVELMERAK